MTAPFSYHYASEPHSRPLAHIHLDSLLSAISACESNLNPLAVNARSGARGLYQFRASTWHSFGTLNHLDAHDPIVARAAATRYLTFLARLLCDHHLPVTILNLATLWTCGTLTRGIPEYSHRVANLYTDSLRNLPLALLPPPSLSSPHPR
jgi:hypothetical protein